MVKKKTLKQEQRRFMKKVLQEQGDVMDRWPRRWGKTRTLVQKIIPVLKSDGKRIHFVKDGLRVKKGTLPKIKKDVDVVILDEFTDWLLSAIKKKHPHVRIVALGTPGCE